MKTGALSAEFSWYLGRRLPDPEDEWSDVQPTPFFDPYHINNAAVWTTPATVPKAAGVPKRGWPLALMGDQKS